MILKDIFRGRKDEIELQIKPTLSYDNFTKLNLSEIKISFTKERYWIIDAKNQRVEIDGINPEDKSNLDLITTQQSISIVANSNKEKKLTLRSVLFREKIKFDKIEIGYGDIILDDIDIRYSKHLKLNNKVKWLEEELLIKSGNKSIALINNSPQENGFSIVGKHIVIDITKKDDKFEISKIKNYNKSIQASTILESDISILDISNTADIGKDVSSKLSKIDENERYLSTWKRYQEEEIKLTKEKQESIGFLRISDVKKIVKDKYKLFFKEDKNSIEWINKIEKDDRLELLKEKKYNSENDEKIIVKLIEKKDSYILVICENEDLEKDKEKIKYALLSIIGDQAIQERRDKALDLIKLGSVPMPQLGTILEGKSTQIIQRRTIKPLTPKIKREFGIEGPNYIQEEALNIALNTPDIAIIQGPPGTGKTKVITALAKRLVEEANKNNQDASKSILLTAFQHDAVENMASRTNILGLPAIKIGKKNSEIDIINKWIYNTNEYITSKQNEMNQETDEILSQDELTYKNIKKYYISYIESLDEEQVKIFFLEFQNQHLSELPISILNKIYSFTQDSQMEIDDKIAKKLINLLNHIDIEAFQNNEFRDVQRFFKRYSFYIEEKASIPKLSIENIKFIKKFSHTYETSEQDLKDLESFKSNYLNLLTRDKKEQSNVLSPSKEIEIIFKELLNFYSEKIKRSGSLYTILSEYKNDINSNKENVKRTIESYSTLLAATVQGAKSKKLINMKPDPFETVIVDEAARAMPLDLLIPLTSAKRRIILVGDHRQLPHIIDGSIQRNLENNEEIAKDYRSHIEKSLFERFYINLKKIEKEDNIKRVITLNIQYRMHPIIGDFISRVFYEREGDPKIESGTPAEQLIHGLSKYKNKVAVSINIPKYRGPEEKYKGSSYRSVEAQEAIKIAKEILDENPLLTVGVITFYAKQVEELYKQALYKNIAFKDDENNFHILKEYSKTKEQNERFRIGSVDAFQGKEFDVVILSLVRSNDHASIKQRFGFLTSYNRLNVAMSRAKKLLITIGDENMFKDNNAKKAVYGLYAFYKELIGGNYGISI